MLASELIERLRQLPADRQVMILDGFNGGGVPREINLGPTERLITAEHAEEAADCEDIVGSTVAIIGFGCY